MSLLKHLLLSVTWVIALILIGTLAFSVDSARQYLSQQLQAQSDSAAASLALTLSQSTNQDPVVQELLISALFDTGQFQRIEMRDSAAQLQVLREQELTDNESSAQAPAWFREYLPLKPASANAQLSDGWKQTGQVVVVAESVSASNALWQAFQRTLILVLVAGVLWAFAVFILMRWLRRALREEIQLGVESIASRGEWQQGHRPVFSELQGVSQIIKQVHERVRATEQEQEARIESLELELHQDVVTGLPNRRYFVNELRKALVCPNGEQPQSGYVLLFRQRDLGELSKRLPRENVDQWLKQVGENVKSLLAKYPAAKQVARLNGSDFIVLLNHIDGPAMAPLTQALLATLEELRIRIPEGGFCRWASALTDYQQGESLGAVLGRLDRVLMQAESAGHAELQFLERDADKAPESLQHAGESQWRELLQTALDSQKFRLQLAPVSEADQKNGFGYRVATLSLTQWQGDLEQSISAYLFMPVAVRLGLSSQCDLRAINLALDYLEQHNESIVLRVSLASIMEPSFLPEVERALKRLEACQGHMYIELDAYGAVAHPEELQRFAQTVRAQQAGLGMRGVLNQPAVLSQLDGLDLRYVNIDHQQLKQMMTTVGGRALVQASQHTAERLNIRIRLDIPAEALAPELKAYLYLGEAGSSS